jgi:3-dehydroquinate dehydratase-2
MTRKILILNGPGLTDLGDYGDGNDRGLTLEKVRTECTELCHSLGIELDFRQTEDQDEMVRWIKKDSEGYDGVIINPVGCSRAATVSFPVYRSAIRTIALLRKPVVEVHMNNIFSRSAETTGSVNEPAGAMGLVCGLGVHGYLLGIRSIAHRFELDAV